MHYSLIIKNPSSISVQINMLSILATLQVTLERKMRKTVID